MVGVQNSKNLFEKCFLENPFVLYRKFGPQSLSVNAFLLLNPALNAAEPFLGVVTEFSVEEEFGNCAEKGLEHPQGEV